MPCRFRKQQPNAFVGIPRRREWRVGRQSKEIVCIEVGKIEPFGKCMAE